MNKRERDYAVLVLESVVTNNTALRGRMSVQRITKAERMFAINQMELQATSIRDVIRMLKPKEREDV